MWFYICVLLTCGSSPFFLSVSVLSVVLFFTISGLNNLRYKTWLRYALPPQYVFNKRICRKTAPESAQNACDKPQRIAALSPPEKLRCAVQRHRDGENDENPRQSEKGDSNRKKRVSQKTNNRRSIEARASRTQRKLSTADEKTSVGSLVAEPPG